MKKFAKMSLAAAVAVAGLSTTASAANLADTIKDTTMSGYLRYRLDTNEAGTATGTTQSNEIKAVYNFKTKVNDIVTANVKFVGKYTNADNTTAGAPAFDINQANFIFKTDMATAIVGVQTAQSPFVANNGDTVANGITALIPAGAATIAAAHYTDTNKDATPYVAANDKDISAAGVIASVAGVNLEAWYATVSASEIDSMAILASGKAGPVSISAHYADEDGGTAATDDVTNAQILVSGAVEGVSLYGAYATTGKDGGDVTLDGDDDSRLILALEQINTQGADIDAYAIGASMPVGPVTVSLDYCDADVGTTVEADETLLTVAYKMSKNLR
jgi:hypothetical protein